MYCDRTFLSDLRSRASTTLTMLRNPLYCPYNVVVNTLIGLASKRGRLVHAHGWKTDHNLKIRHVAMVQGSRPSGAPETTMAMAPGPI